MTRFLALLGAACIAGTHVAPATAAFPERPITMIVPFTAGGGTDIGSRIWTQYLEKCLGGKQPVIVQNKPGAGGQIGMAEVAKAAPDGYTLIGLNQPNVQVGPITKSNSAYTIDSFDYLGTFHGSRTTLAVLKESPIKSVPQLIEDAKKSGKPIEVGISGIGSDDHQLILKLKRLTGVSFKTIPFGDSAGIQTALLGGHTPMATVNTVGAAQFADKMRALAVASEQRAEDLPDVPTFREIGINIINGSTHSIGGPKGMAKEAKDKITACFDTIGKDPTFLADIKKRALFPTVMNGEETRKFVMEEYETLKAIWATDPWE